ncbi:MAG: efflux transporter outer membrane subunit [Burkholderiaceae bacterium]|nr:efflux transporter outer membrane subunit [Burkholderiaceae bacterium]
MSHPFPLICRALGPRASAPVARRRSGGLVLLTLAALAGCAQGPDYRRPDVDAPTQWRETYAPGAVTRVDAWWRLFGDEALDALVRETLAGNADLRIALARIEQYEARVQVAKASRYPQVDGIAARQRLTMSQEKPVPLPSTIAPTNNQYEAGYVASWELDLWGRVRRSNEAALADLLARREEREAVVLTLVTEVVTGYLTLLQLDQQIALLQREIANREAAWKSQRAKAEGGAISWVQVETAKSVYEEKRSELPLKQHEVAVLEHQLSYLAGRAPAAIRRGRSFDALVVPGIPAGLPSEILEQRPDIRRAEQDLVAANARIGVARAAYFPTISLTGAAGYASTRLSNLTELTANFWSYGIQAAGNLFDGGRISAQVAETEARRKELVETYRRSIQAAFREVNDALAKHRLLGDRMQAQRLQLAAAREAEVLARRRYDNGYSSYLEVLDAEKRVLQSEITHTQSRANQLDALVAVFRAMGGGWTGRAEQLAGLPAPVPSSK